MRLARSLVMAALLALVAAAPAAASGVIRVALIESTRAVELRGTDVEISELGVCVRCTQRRVAVVRAIAAGDGVEVDGARAAGFRLRSERPITLNGREYPSPIDVVRNGDGLAVVNELPLEDYVVGVLRAEVGEKWPLEALRAQAVVARTYAAYHRTIGGSKPYHIVASTANQQFAGRVPPTSPLWGAVRETAGQVLLWEGELFPAFYHTESGGYTEDPRTVFAARNMPGLKPVRCDFSAGSPHYYWSLDMKLSDLADVLRRSEVGVGDVIAIDVSERTPSLRAAIVTVHGTGRSVRLRGNDFRKMLGYDTFKSTLFAVAVDAAWARFSGRGYGHGVGLCQWGAKGMAEQGHGARQILDFYYPGTTLTTLDRLAR
ncbi:MAG TPA: SpoIID/LytB domain-containing protein [Methylomirabilota bacterium]|jgi:stage II sporulation protein D|nr:SpoIID/LytB domain-containing protein [Methylomirabilota bacterium]